MEIGQLRCFIAVAEEGHFGRAAKRLNMTQPPLSRQIRLLEETVGVSLFERSTRSVRLTAAGELLVPEARRVLILMDKIRETGRSLSNGTSGSIKLGFTSGAGYAFLPRLVSAVSAALPQVMLQLDELGTSDQMDALAVGNLDAAIVRPPESRQGIELVCVSREVLHLAVPHSHRLAHIDRPICPVDLQDEAFLMYSPDNNRYLYGLVSGIMRKVGIIPSRLQFARAIHTILPLVGVGFGLAIVPDSARQLRVPGVVLRSLAAEISGTADLYLGWRSDHQNPALTEVLTSVLPLCQTLKEHSEVEFWHPGSR